MKHSALRGMPPTENFIAALVASRLGSFSGAASELGLTHTAISRRIALLERWMGTPIFERHGRGVSPTAEGQRILARLTAALGELSSLRLARPEQRLPMVRIAVTPAFARFWLLPRLRAIEGQPPSVRVDVLVDAKHADLTRGEVDLAVRYGRARSQDSTQQLSVRGWRVGAERRLFQETLVPVVARSLLQSAAPMQVSDLLRFPLLHGDDTTTWRAWKRVHAPLAAAKPRDRVLGDYALAVDAAASGLGVALWNVGLHPVASGMVAMDNFRIETSLSHHLLSRLSDAEGPASQVASRLIAAC